MTTVFVVTERYDGNNEPNIRVFASHIGAKAQVLWVLTDERRERFEREPDVNAQDEILADFQKHIDDVQTWDDTTAYTLCVSPDCIIGLTPVEVQP